MTYGGQDKLVVIGYMNTSFQSEKDDFRSYSSFMVYLNEREISWKRGTIANSTIKVVYIIAIDAATEVVW